MPVLMVAYELKGIGRDYTPVFETIKRNSNGWWHYIDNVWLSNTEMSADTFAKALLPYLLTTDRLLVVRITQEHQGWLTQDAWDWINQRTY